MSEHYIPNGYSLTSELSSERVTQFKAPGQGTEPGKAYAVVLETSKGRMVAELYADKAPVTVNSFVWLLRNHYYDGIVFHRVLDGFMAQTGDPTGTGRGGPGYTFQDEFNPKASIVNGARFAVCSFIRRSASGAKTRRPPRNSRWRISGFSTHRMSH